MDTFTFSEAARLYAANIAVVNEMWELFKADIGRFQDTLKAAIRRNVRPLSVEEDISKGNRSWWLSRGGVRERPEQPYLCMERENPETISPGQLKIFVRYDGSDEVVRREVSLIRDSFALPAHCTVAPLGKYFVLVINYQDSDPIGACVEPITAILRKLDGIE